MLISAIFLFEAPKYHEPVNLGIISPFKNILEDNEKIAISSKINAKSKIKKINELSVRGKCSCSLYSDYKTHRANWINYCPQCHKYGTLEFTKGGDSPEGMLYCTSCDADFCVVHGKEHVYSHPTYLTQA